MIAPIIIPHAGMFWVVGANWLEPGEKDTHILLGGEGLLASVNLPHSYAQEDLISLAMAVQSHAAKNTWACTVDIPSSASHEGGVCFFAARDGQLVVDMYLTRTQAGEEADKAIFAKWQSDNPLDKVEKNPSWARVVLEHLPPPEASFYAHIYHQQQRKKYRRGFAFVGGGAVCALVGAFFFLAEEASLPPAPVEEAALPATEAVAEEANFNPWSFAPSTHRWLASCMEIGSEAPLALPGWEFDTIRCTGNRESVKNLRIQVSYKHRGGLGPEDLQAFLANNVSSKWDLLFTFSSSTQDIALLSSGVSLPPREKKKDLLDYELLVVALQALKHHPGGEEREFLWAQKGDVIHIQGNTALTPPLWRAWYLAAIPGAVMEQASFDGSHWHLRATVHYTNKNKEES